MGFIRFVLGDLPECRSQRLHKSFIQSDGIFFQETGKGITI